MGSATGLPTAWLERLQAAAERHVGDEKVPGLIALVACGSQVHVEALGRLSVGGPPVACDALFQIASTTNPSRRHAGPGRRGLIGLDEPVDRLLPELATRRVLRRMDGPLEDTVLASRPITTRDLLTFTFGFGMVGEMFAPPQPWPIVAAADELRLATIGLAMWPAVQPDPDTWIAGSAACRCWPSPATAGCTTPAPWCSACGWPGRRAGRSARCCGHLRGNQIAPDLGSRRSVTWTSPAGPFLEEVAKEVVGPLWVLAHGAVIDAGKDLQLRVWQAVPQADSAGLQW
jgi:hypothetical protein